MNRMHLQFESDLEYQKRAVEAVCGLFAGAERGSGTFSVVMPIDTGRAGDNLGLVSNAERNILDNALSTRQIEQNLGKVQEANGIEREDKCEDLHFTVEMETGTGKTYVYLRSIYELNKRYGFKKFWQCKFFSVKMSITVMGM